MSEPEVQTSSLRYVYLAPLNESEMTDLDEGTDLRDLSKTLLTGAWTIALFVIVFALAGAVYLFFATKLYQANVTLLPALPSSPSSVVARFGGLASLAGLEIPSAGSEEPLAVLRSKKFIWQFIQDKNLLPVLFSAKWNRAEGRWAVPLKKQPDIRDGVRYFDRYVRTVAEDKKTGLVTLGIKWKDGTQAAEWANLLATRLNNQLRAEAISRAQISIDYLQREMASATVVSLQQAIGQVLEQQMQKMALARANTEFAFRIIDPAFPPKRPSSPRAALVVTSSILAGGLVGIFFVLARDAVRRSAKAS